MKVRGWDAIGPVPYRGGHVWIKVEMKPMGKRRSVFHRTITGIFAGADLDLFEDNLHAWSGLCLQEQATHMPLQKAGQHLDAALTEAGWSHHQRLRLIAAAQTTPTTLSFV